MIQATGCISIRAVNATSIQVDRIIESVCIDVRRRTCTIWADVCLANFSGDEQTVTVFHRGNLRCRNVTNSAWSAGEADGPDLAVTARLISLHETLDPIEIIGHESVRVADVRYALWNGPTDLKPVIPAPDRSDVPYTAWEVGPLVARSRQIFRLKLEATPECYNTQIGQGDTIYAYGDSILWQRIEHDLRTYTGPNAEDYRLRFLEGGASFRTSSSGCWFLQILALVG